MLGNNLTSMEVPQQVQVRDPEVAEYQTVEYWKRHFSEHCQISLEYFTVDDGTKLLTVFAKNKNNPNSTPVVLIAGWFSQIFGWSEVTKIVSEQTSVIYVESREKNSSILPDYGIEMGVDRMAEDLNQIFDWMPYDIENAIVVASSMGGTTMFSYLGKRLPAPKASILIGPNPHFEFPRVLVVPGLKLPLPILKILKSFMAWYILKFRVDTENEPEQAEKYEAVLRNADIWKIRQSARECLWYRAWDIFSDIEANVILVGASADKMHAAEQTMLIVDEIKDSKFVDFPSNRATHSETMGNFILEYIEKNEIPDNYL